MAPKPRVFKTPDGKEFTSKAEWRDYMMATFYSFKGVKGGKPDPKMPGTIDGQMFDIADCEDAELVVMDHCEQVQIDEVKNCRVLWVLVRAPCLSATAQAAHSLLLAVNCDFVR